MKETGQDLKVLCLVCWFHIKEFHEFYQNVIKSRNSFEDTFEVNKLQLEVKTENCEQSTQVLLSKDDRDESLEDVFVKSDDEDVVSDGIDKMSITSNNEDELDDEQPLITLKKIKNFKTKNKENEYLKTDSNKNREEAFKKTDLTCARRKSKSYLKKEALNVTRNSRKVESRSKKSKIVNNEKPDKTVSNLEKGIESDSFIAEWKPELECDLCEETCSNFQKLRLHFKEKHKSKGYIKCCERKFYRRYVLVEHIRMHLNPEMHKCNICGKLSSSQYNLKLHKRIMHESTKQFECTECHKLFNQKPTLERHLLTHVTGNKDFVCQECGKAYVLEIQLKSHIKTVHNVDRVCDQCGKIVHGKPALKKHMMEHAGIEKPKFPCKECGAELNSRNSLRRHMASFHHDGTTIYVCSICGKVAATENALLTHKKHVHEEERKHKCTYCDKAFKRPKVLREHIATHTGQDLYQCPHCPQTFKVSANMHHHRKKMHPKEWEEGRKNRLQLPIVNIDQVKHQVVV